MLTVTVDPLELAVVYPPALKFVTEGEAPSVKVTAVLAEIDEGGVPDGAAWKYTPGDEPVSTTEQVGQTSALAPDFTTRKIFPAFFVADVSIFPFRFPIVIVGPGPATPDVTRIDPP